MISPLTNIERQEKAVKVDIALYFGPSVTLFEQIYNDKQRNHFVTTDVETDNHMILVTLQNNNMDEIIRRCAFINGALYNNQKRIILFAPNYDDEKSIDYLKMSPVRAYETE